MRLIVIGCEYAGKSTLIDGLAALGKDLGMRVHLDDHFSIPDEFFLKPDDQAAMLAMPPTIKERFQRFQVYYHVHLVSHYDDILLGGYHIEEAIYGRRYYYPAVRIPDYVHQIEAQLPNDTILCLLTASPEVIRARMKAAPHRYPIVRPEDVETVSQEFESLFRTSWLARRLAIDTSALSPEGLLDTFRRRVKPFLSTHDLLRWPQTDR